MTSPIDLDDEGDLVAKEIHDAGTDRLLAAEFQSGETCSAQAVPEHPFGDCRVPADPLAFLICGGIGRPSEEAIDEFYECFMLF